ncbi:MAG: hypothetical protein ACJAVM_002726 [Sulfitobacter sp.]|jgi:Gamma-glutamyl cyclotransferase, AIG2-like
MTPYFFGYGSLVNRKTHTYPDAHPARLNGWRRAWVRTRLRDIVYLTVVPDKNCSIDGLVAAVPAADWSALDLRETGYHRHHSGLSVTHPIPDQPDIAHYVVSPDNMVAAGEHGILLSYLDVVVQGFLHEFGTAGVSRFFDTTQGWDTPVFDDRATPSYPRHQTLTAAETALVDHHLNRLSTPVKQGHQTPLAFD